MFSQAVTGLEPSCSSSSSSRLLAAVLEGGRPQGKPLIKICDFGYESRFQSQSYQLDTVLSCGMRCIELISTLR